MIADLPRVDELNSLPLRSQVAFAVRCTWRVRHLFKLEGQSDPAADRASLSDFEKLTALTAR